MLAFDWEESNGVSNGTHGTEPCVFQVSLNRSMILLTSIQLSNQTTFHQYLGRILLLKFEDLGFV